ncbi:unnamed protein product [Microthlaspi erraticum]|uniref:Uncharacterized protein n=1 Tax=Microthlaspi erraticum TaxID=1685480 RepID=A0A6D2KD39_9BRAS|nr:unnamed protein product [Microthlaspi erraticum]
MRDYGTMRERDNSLRYDFKNPRVYNPDNPPERFTIREISGKLIGPCTRRLICPLQHYASLHAGTKWTIELKEHNPKAIYANLKVNPSSRFQCFGSFVPKNSS